MRLHGSLGPRAHRIPVCNGTFVSPGGGGTVTCSGILSQVERYVAQSQDGTDTDHMFLLPFGDPPFSGLIGSAQ